LVVMGLITPQQRLRLVQQTQGQAAAVVGLLALSQPAVLAQMVSLSFAR